MKLNEIRIRDPFILPQPATNKYYLFGTTDNEGQGDCGFGFDAYTSHDLRNWDGPIPAFRPPANFWSSINYWAPEVHEYQGRFYMFASFKAPGVCRGTQILVSDQPEGPYLPHSDGPVTPKDWECLDGTLYVDKAGDPWMVFCHEWIQIGDGTICAFRLSPDLKKSIDDPTVLFAASSAKWSIENCTPKFRGQVTDGPFLYENEEGSLLMLWSSMGRQGYAMGCAISRSGQLTGHWEQQDEAFYSADGGHGMLFRDFKNQLFLVLHAPNHNPHERAQFIPLVEKNGTIDRDSSREIIQ